MEKELSRNLKISASIGLIVFVISIAIGIIATMNYQNRIAEGVYPADEVESSEPVSSPEGKDAALQQIRDDTVEFGFPAIAVSVDSTDQVCDQLTEGVDEYQVAANVSQGMLNIGDPVDSQASLEFVRSTDENWCGRF